LNHFVLHRDVQFPVNETAISFLHFRSFSSLRNCINQFGDRYSNRENKEECFPRVMVAETLAASLNLTVHYTPNYLKAIANPMGYILPHAYTWKYNYESANSVHTLGISGARLIYCPTGGGGFHRLLT